MKILTIMMCMVLAGCGARTVQEKKEEPKQESSAASDCLEQYIDTPSQLLTKEMVLSLVKIASDQLIEDKSEGNKRTEWNSLDYSWDIGRTSMFNGMKLSLSNSISLHGIEVIKAANPIEDFHQKHKMLTESEREYLMAQMKEQLKKQLEKGEITEEEYEMSQPFTGVFAKLNYQPVNEKVGDVAIWDATRTKMSPVSAGALVVQSGKVRFRLNVDVGGEDDQESKKLAIALAKLIIAGCG